MSLGKYKLALKDYEGVFKARPNDKDAKLKYTECKKIVQQIAFQKAISVEETKKSMAETIDIESMAVDDKYDGPRLEDGKVTLAFMKDLMEAYKGQKCLHRRYAFKMLLGTNYADGQDNPFFETLAASPVEPSLLSSVSSLAAPPSGASPAVL